MYFLGHVFCQRLSNRFRSKNHASHIKASNENSASSLALPSLNKPLRPICDAHGRGGLCFKRVIRAMLDTRIFARVRPSAWGYVCAKDVHKTPGLQCPVSTVCGLQVRYIYPYNAHRLHSTYGRSAITQAWFPFVRVFQTGIGQRWQPHRLHATAA